MPYITSKITFCAGGTDKQFASDIAEIKRATGSYRAVPVGIEDERALLDAIDAAADAYVSDMSMLVKMRLGGASIEKMDKAIKGVDQPIYAAFVKLHELIAHNAAEATKRFGDGLDYAEAIIGILVLVATLFSIALAIWLTAAISRNITASATRLSAASIEIAATVVQHERTATQQAAAVNETSATIDELSASSRQLAEQAAIRRRWRNVPVPPRCWAAMPPSRR